MKTTGIAAEPSAELMRFSRSTVPSRTCGGCSFDSSSSNASGETDVVGKSGGGDGVCLRVRLQADHPEDSALEPRWYACGRHACPPPHVRLALLGSEFMRFG